MRSPILVAAVIGAALAPACARSGTAKRPSVRRSDAGAEPQRIVFAPKDEGADRYNDPPVTTPPRSRLGDAIVDQVETLSTQLGKSAPVPDGRLFAACDDIASVTPDRGTVAYRLVEFALQRHGIIEPSPHLLVIRGPSEDPAPILEQLELQLMTTLAETDFRRIGVGTAKRDGEDVIVVALQSSFIRTGPVPRTLPNGGVASLSGSILPPFTSPHVYITRESGDVVSPPVRTDADGAFATQVDCGERTGPQQVEITATDRTGSVVLANFPIFCREVPPVSISVDLTGDDAAVAASPGEAEKRMIEMINRDREKNHVPPLQVDERLTAVARAHSQDMVDTGFVGHISPNTGSAADRVAAGGIKTSVVLENVARAYGLDEAEQGLMNSPGHRANLLSPQVTHVGVGIIMGKGVEGSREMYVTQVFIRIPAPIDRDAVIARVGKKIRAVRPLLHDSWLSEVAQPFAESLASGVPTQVAAAKASETLRTRPGYRGVTTVATTVADVAAFDPAGSLDDPTITHFGIGVAQGDHPEIGEGAIFIVILLGHR